MAAQIGLGKRLVVCTHGKDGATALTPDGQWYDVPIILAYPRRDINGAGDAFFSGVLAAHAEGRPIVECLRVGTIVAGLCITSPELALPELSAELVAREYAKFV
jgi:sugar/nucleoside kinase (ribokinase family)